LAVAALDVPMYFVYRPGAGYVDTSGESFREFMEGRLKALPGEKATMDDWENHLTTLFPDVSPTELYYGLTSP
jgi:glutamate--cysteine ligase